MITDGKIEFVRKMLKEEKPLLSFGYFEVPIYFDVGYCCDIYRCISCLTYFEISSPENSFRGSFKKINVNKVMLSTDYKIQQGRKIFVFSIAKELEIMPFLRNNVLNAIDAPYEIINFRLKVGWLGRKNDFILLRYKHLDNKKSFLKKFDEIITEYYKNQCVSDINFIHLSDDSQIDLDLIRYIKNRIF